MAKMLGLCKKPIDISIKNVNFVGSFNGSGFIGLTNNRGYCEKTLVFS